MLAILIGDFSLLLGFFVMLLPLVVTEMSRPKDAFWGSVVILLGLVLVTTNDLLIGAPMLAVVLGALLVSRLGYEVVLSRWQSLSIEEKHRLRSLERWTTGLQQVGVTLFQLGGIFLKPIKFVFRKPNSNTITKKWVRPEKAMDLEVLEQEKTQPDMSSQSSKDDLQKQPQQTLEGHSTQKDS